MNNVAFVDFGQPRVEPTNQEVRVADVDDGYTRTANELLDALIEADLTKHQYKVMLALIRKTYGFNKSFDRITNTQIAEMTGIHHTHICKAKNELIERGLLVLSGRMVGVNNVVSDWKSKVSRNSESLAETAKQSLAETANGVKQKQLNTKDTIQKTIQKTKDLKNTSAEPAIADSPQVVTSEDQPAVITLPLNTGEQHPVTQGFAEQMAQLYPAVDVVQELRAMLGWLLTNPAKRKTRKGISRFINNWLQRCQDRGGSSGMSQSSARPGSAIAQAQAQAHAYQAEHGPAYDDNTQF